MGLICKVKFNIKFIVIIKFINIKFIVGIINSKFLDYNILMNLTLLKFLRCPVQSQTSFFGEVRSDLHHFHSNSSGYCEKRGASCGLSVEQEWDFQDVGEMWDFTTSSIHE